MTVHEPLEAADGWLLCTTLPAVPTSVPRARGLVRDVLAALDAAPEPAADVALAVSEAAANAALHAYDPGQEGTFDLCARCDGSGVLRVTVRDYGLGFRATRHRGAGLGLILMRRLAGECRIERADPGVTVRLAFAIHG